MVVLSRINLYYVTRCDIKFGWTAVNEHNCLKYQAIYIGLYWEADKMTVYANLKACCLDVEGWSWIKVFHVQKDGQQATANLRDHCEGDSEVNKHVTLVTENIDNTHFTSEHTYSFDKLSAMLQDAFTILNNNTEIHSDNQMLRKMFSKTNLPNNSKMDTCKRIYSNNHVQNFVNAVVYLSGQVIDIFQNAQIKIRRNVGPRR